MTYRVSLSPAGVPHWWVEGAHIPLSHTHIREARFDEAEIMDRISRGGVGDRIYGAELRSLLARRAPVPTMGAGFTGTG